MKKVRQIIAFLGIFSICISCASANEINITPRGWDIIAMTNYGFDIDDDGFMTAVGATTAIKSATKVTVGVYVERQKTGGWSVVPGMSWTSSSTTSTYVGIEKTRYLDKGWSYRLRVEHSATGESGTEYATSYSEAYYYG